MDPGDEKARFLTEICETRERIAEQVRAAAESGSIPLVLGGDHRVAIGTIGGLASPHGPGGVPWFDAHADFNTPETTPSGAVHGMPSAACSGAVGFESNSWVTPRLEPERVALIGARGYRPGGAPTGPRGRYCCVHDLDVDRRGVEPV